MTTVPSGRRIEQAAVNALRALLQRHDHVVEVLGERHRATSGRGPQGSPAAYIAPVALIGAIILDMPEALWLASCFSATEWVRRCAEVG
ncbi:hypothetical protein AB0M92_13770 [Streptomyces sp. NPDC051582]|uniref:hypothetical protein n=1 Tax=Streptomyces sp. NPDC051582 TaxID=3155167 RepID=UPI0034388358